MSAVLPRRGDAPTLPLPAPAEGEPLLPPGATYTSVTEMVAAPMVEPRPWRLWWYATGVCALLTLAMLGAILVLFGTGIGTWGVNSVVVWGFAIASYVWWVAIGSGGTLISSMLLLTRQPWRSSVSRAVETMTMVAVAIAGLFPILHLGRPWLFYWLVPYPNTMDVWPQWRSALVWDFWAILSYLLFSVLFWYLGALPDLATMRDRARGKAARYLYGALALGWRGSAGQWHRYEVAYKTIGALGVPLVVGVHSVVGLDFAASLMPGWQESIFPPYFVVGALFSGFASVIAVAIVVRWGLGLQALVTRRHFDAMGKVLLAGSILMTYCYATEWWMAWYSGKDAEREVAAYMFGGDYAWLYRTQLVLNCVLPHVLWFRRVRRSPLALLPLVLLIDVGMWIERILIIFNTLGRGYLPSLWRTFHPTLWDWTLLFTPFGFFGLMMLLACRLVPMVAIHEMRQLVREREAQA